MNLFTRLRMALSPGRTITGRLLNESTFWTEVQRAAFLLDHLRDDDLNWSLPDHYLRRVKSLLNLMDDRRADSEVEFEAISNLYLAWIAISVQISELKDIAEIDTWWMYRLSAAADHVLQRVFPALTPDTQSRFLQYVPAMYRACNENSVWMNS